jgi:hypothetical protein
MEKQITNINIRIANKKDAELISLLGRVTFTETFGHLFYDKQTLFDYCNLTFSIDKIEKSITKPNNIFWIAYANRLPVGYAKLKLNSQSKFIIEKHICQLQKIYVLQDFLSLKIGFKLQTALINKAKEKKFKKIWLSVVISNERAIKFYLNNGFTQIGNHDFQIGKYNFEFIAMVKLLE